MKAESARQIKDLVELEKFTPETLCSSESWMWMSAPSANENPARPVWC
ncbi:KorC [Salmonella enterica]|nr:KorC [Salmonella enterica]SUH19535.1 KorC [Salmonella enterica]